MAEFAAGFNGRVKGAAKFRGMRSFCAIAKGASFG
jgi:hypothetical protein